MKIRVTKIDVGLALKGWFLKVWAKDGHVNGGKIGQKGKVLARK